MRRLPLAMVTLVGLAGPALAQNYPPGYVGAPYGTATPDASPSAVPRHGGPPGSSAAANTGPGDTRSEIAPRLPTPQAGEDATTQQFLVSARQALAAGRTGEAQEALERAETRLLDRSVEYNAYKEPIRGPELGRISAARRALGAGDLPGATRLLDEALGGAR